VFYLTHTDTGARCNELLDDTMQPAVSMTHDTVIPTQETQPTMTVTCPQTPHKIDHYTNTPNNDQAIPTPAEGITITNEQENIKNRCCTCTSYKQCPLGECWAAQMTCYICQARGHLASRCTGTRKHLRENSETTRN